MARKKEPKLEGRVRYEENWRGEREYFIFEIKWTNEKEWGLETAYPCVDDKVHWSVIAHFRKWQDLGISYYIQ